MSLLPIGAINKKTLQHTSPYTASKYEDYKCPDKKCGEDVIFRQGDKNRPHFAHLPNSLCTYYAHPSETAIHQSGKIALKYLLQNYGIVLSRQCGNCGKKEEYELINESNCKVKTEEELEHFIDFNGKTIKPDVACFDEKDDLYCIFEVLHTHKTSPENRPEPWFEIRALDIMKISSENFTTSLGQFIIIPCVRSHLCDTCIERGKILRRVCDSCSGFGIFESATSPSICKICVVCCRGKKDLCERCGLLSKMCIELSTLQKELKKINSIIRKLNKMGINYPIRTLKIDYHIGDSFTKPYFYDSNLFQLTFEKLKEDARQLEYEYEKC